MSPDTIAHLANNNSFLIIFGALALMISLTIVIFTALPKLREYLIPRYQETRLADFLPFDKTSQPYDDLIKSENGSITRIFHIQGVDYYFATDPELREFNQAKLNLIRLLSQYNIPIKIFTDRETVENDPAVLHNDKNFAALTAAYEKNVKSASANQHYLVITLDPEDTENLQLKKIDEITTTIITTLKRFKVTVLTETQEDTTLPTPAEYYARKISPVTRPKISLRSSGNLNENLVSDYAEFGDDEGDITFFSGKRKKYLNIHAVRGFEDSTSLDFALELQRINGDVTIFQYIKPYSKVQAQSHLTLLSGPAKAASPKKETSDQFEAANTLVEGQGGLKDTFCKWAVYIFAYADSLETMDAINSNIRSIASEYRVNTSLLGTAGHKVWWSQFPTYDNMPHELSPFANNVTRLMPFQYTPQGPHRSDWGPGPIGYFRTAEHNAYRFQFHQSSRKEELGNCLFIGPAGTGKTTLMELLELLAARHDILKIFNFDRHRGIEVFTKAMKGTYLSPTGEAANVGFNPFQLPDNEVNRSFLRTFLQICTGATEPEDLHKIGQLVATNYMVDPANRNLKELYKACFKSTDPLSTALLPWISDEMYGRIFCAETDGINLSSRITSFDFTTILDDPKLAPAAAAYIMHCIDNATAAQGEPALIFVDETQPLIMNDHFKEELQKKLLEARKLRQVFALAFQKPESVFTNGMGQAILGQCPTVFFFRNTRASASDYEHFNLNMKELDFILGRSHEHLPHAVLMKRSSLHGESVVLNIDLSHMGPYLKLFASGREKVLLAERLQKEYGDDYLPHFLEQAA